MSEVIDHLDKIVKEVLESVIAMDYPTAKKWYWNLTQVEKNYYYKHHYEVWIAAMMHLADLTADVIENSGDN